MPNTRIVEQKVYVENIDDIIPLLGKYDRHLDLVEENFDILVIPRGNELLLQGEKEVVEEIFFFFQELISVIKRGHKLTTAEFEYAIGLVKSGESSKIKELFGSNHVFVTSRGKQIKAKTLGQKLYLESMLKNDIVFCIGPAGTGKTYLALAVAIKALKTKQVQRLVLTRPAVEAGEHLGFLPGDLQEKVDPYLRPIYDGLYDLLGFEAFQKYKERGVIEIAPLAYMRGRTLDDSFIILDEAQNTTGEQMKMFLTRFGFGSKAVITGDITQVDLPPGKHSGLEQVERILKGIEGLSFVYLTNKDVVRHTLVQKIIRAYEAHENHS
ncbi:MAG: PhoH family protein [Dethiobacteria bacterium]